MATSLDAVSGAVEGIAVTPDNDVTFATTRAVHVGSDGDVAVTWANGTETIMPGCNKGAEYPWQVIKIRADGTTASGIVRLY